MLRNIYHKSVKLYGDCPEYNKTHKAAVAQTQKKYVKQLTDSRFLALVFTEFVHFGHPSPSCYIHKKCTAASMSANSFENECLATYNILKQ